jgi:hypothetical protein
MRRLERAIARDVDMDNLEEAMDHFVDVFECLLSPYTGCGISRPLLDKFSLSLINLAYEARIFGPEVASGFHSLVQSACSDIRRIKIRNINSEEHSEEDRAAIRSLGSVLVKHVNIFVNYLEPHRQKHREEAGENGVVAEIELADPSGNGELTSIQVQFDD